MFLLIAGKGCMSTEMGYILLEILLHQFFFTFNMFINIVIQIKYAANNFCSFCQRRNFLKKYLYFRQEQPSDYLWKLCLLKNILILM